MFGSLCISDPQMPRTGKERKTPNNKLLDKPCARNFRYPNINFSFFPRNNDLFSYKVEELMPGVLVCDEVFSETECKILVQSCKEFFEPTNKNNARPKKGEAFRNNERYLHTKQDENEAFSDQLWRERLSPILLSERNKHLFN